MRTYRAAYVQTNAPVNRAGWHDAQARMIVLEKDVEATLDGTRAPEPLFIRAQSGEWLWSTAESDRRAARP